MNRTALHPLVVKSGGPGTHRIDVTVINAAVAAITFGKGPRFGFAIQWIRPLANYRGRGTPGVRLIRWPILVRLLLFLVECGQLGRQNFSLGRIQFAARVDIGKLGVK